MSQPPIQFRNPGDSTESVLAGEVCLELGGSARSSVARLLLQLTVGRRLLAGLILLVVLPGCLFVAPIEEEPPEEDLPPRIPIENALGETNLVPQLGTQVINLDTAPIVPFAVFEVEDPNEQQNLYSRVLVEYRSALLSPNSANVEITPDERLDDRVIDFQYNPCDLFYANQRNPDDGTDDDEHVIYIAVADAPWADQREVFTQDTPEDRLRLALRTELPEDPNEQPRNPSVIAWGIKLDGACP